MIDSQLIQQDGLCFTVERYEDNDCDPPWENSDGHGVVRKGESHRVGGGKKACERPLNYAGRYEIQYFYDWRATIKKAKEESWGVSDKVLEEMTKALGKPPTKGEILERALESDFKYLQGYVQHEWRYIGIRVVWTDQKSDAVVSQDCWCVPDIPGDWEEVRDDLINQVGFLVRQELNEVRYWEERGILTLRTHPHPFL